MANVAKRRFLKALGGVSSWVAAKASAPALDAAGVSVGFFDKRYPDNFCIDPTDINPDSDLVSEINRWRRKAAKAQYLKLLAPEWELQSARKNASAVSCLDVDIAALVSVSPAAKVRMQRERQIAAYLDVPTQFTAENLGRALFELQFAKAFPTEAA